MARRLYAGALALACATGCGSNPSSTDAGSSSDGTGGSATASSGAGAAGGGPTHERVVLRDRRGGPAAGVDVVLHDADGAVAGRATTDMMGIASVDVPDGGGVSVVWKEGEHGYDIRNRVTSVLGVPRGGEVRLVVDRPIASAPKGYMILDFVGPGTSHPDAYDVDLSCDAESNLGEAEQQMSGCTTSDTFDVVVHYKTPGGDQLQVFKAEPFIQGKQKSYNLDLAASTPAPEVKLTLDDVPADAMLITSEILARRPQGGTNYVGELGQPTGTGTDVQSFLRPYADDGGSYALVADVVHPTGLVELRRPVTDLDAPMTWSVTDLARVGGITLGGTPARPVVGWAHDAKGTNGQAEAITLEWHVTTGPIADWTTYVAGAAQATVKLPQLPADFAEWAPSAPYLDSVVVENQRAKSGDGVLAVANADSDRVELETSLGGLAQPSIP